MNKLSLILINLIFSNILLFAQLNENYLEIKEKYGYLIEQPRSYRGQNHTFFRRYFWENRNNFDEKGNYIYTNNKDFNDKSNYLKENDNKLNSNSWTPIGPIVKPPTYEPRSCYSMGRVNCIAFHPNDKNIFWIGTPGGGVWKTIDGGKNWQPLTDNMPTLAISHIAINPKEPDIIYIATGDFDISGLTDDDALGVYKSTNGGKTWAKTGLDYIEQLKNSVLRKIIINFHEPNNILVAGKKGIWKSTDAGNTWRQVSDSLIMDLEVSPENSSLLLAAMGTQWGNGTAGILRSTDFGENWTPIKTDIPPKNAISRMDVAFSPAEPNYAYCLAVNQSTNAFYGLYMSSDAGKTWNTQSLLDSTNNILGAWGGDKNDTYGQGSYDLVLLPDSKDKSKIYTGGINIWMSNDYGKSWEIASFWIYSFGNSIHADHHYADYNRLDSCYYWCNDGGLYRTKEILPGSKDWINNWIDKYEENLKPGAPKFEFPTKWEELNDGLAITEFYRISLSKNNPYVLAGGSQDNSCYYYNNGNWLNYIPNYDGMETMIHNDNPDIFYGVWQNGGICKTTDGGKTITTRLNSSIKEGGNWITPVAMDPINSDIIYAGYKNVWKSTDGGNTWQKFFNIDSNLFKTVNRNSWSIIKISPIDRNIIAIFKDASWYQDTSKNWIRSNGELWITNDGGLNWVQPKNLPVNQFNISGITFDSKNPLKFWVAFDSYIDTINTFVTFDGGATFKNISKKIPGGLQIRSIVYQPSSTDILYIGTRRGVYYTDNNLKEWIPYNQNLPNCIINDLEVQWQTREIFAGSYGRGIWKTNLIIDDINENDKYDGLFSISPNPAKDYLQINLNWQINLNSQINFKLMDIKGYQVYNSTKNINEFPIKINLNLPNGVYFALLNINGKNYTSKFIIEK